MTMITATGMDASVEITIGLGEHGGATRTLPIPITTVTDMRNRTGDTARLTMTVDLPIDWRAVHVAADPTHDTVTRMRRVNRAHRAGTKIPAKR